MKQIKHSKHTSFIKKQEASESIEACISALRQLAKHCNIGQLEDKIIRNQVVMGVRDEVLREKMLENNKLDLAQCLSIGRVHETSKQQAHVMTNQEQENMQINRIPARQMKYQSAKPKNETFRSQEHKRCTRCGKSPMHGRKDYPAKDAEWRNCFSKSHYAIMCRSKKKVHNIEEEDQEEVVLGSIEVCRAKECVSAVKEGLWHATLEVNRKSVRFRVDTGADVSVVPGRYFKKNSPVIEKTNKKLIGPGKTEIKVVGKFTTTLKTEKTATTQDLYIEENFREPLLGRSAIEALHLFERVDSTQQSTSSASKLPSLFTGLRKMKTVYKIRLRDLLQPQLTGVPQ